jgi:hypothetical protein
MKVTKKEIADVIMLAIGVVVGILVFSTAITIMVAIVQAVF